MAANRIQTIFLIRSQKDAENQERENPKPSRRRGRPVKKHGEALKGGGGGNREDGKKKWKTGRAGKGTKKIVGFLKRRG